MEIHILRLPLHEPVRVGTLWASRDGAEFRYEESYLSSEAAVPLSLSLPLRNEPYSRSAMQPYFEGLLPEGPARIDLAQQIGIREEDSFALLAECGRECIGDVMTEEDGASRIQTASYTELGDSELHRLFTDGHTLAAENAASRMSLAGTQGKVGLARGADGKWYRPQGLAASTHILKTSNLHDEPAVEFLCMRTASRCGLDAAEVELLDFGKPVLAVKRFDRNAMSGNEGLTVQRLHQEDLAQAMGIWPRGKYTELKGGTICAIAELLRQQSARPLEDLKQFAAILLFNYAVGNCDAHLKNYSLRYRADEVELAPAYDLVSTSYFPRFSRELAVSYGGVRDIDLVGPSELEQVAKDLGISRPALHDIAQGIAENIVHGIMDSVGKLDIGMQDLGYTVAEDLIDEVTPRLNVIQKL